MRSVYLPNLNEAGWVAALVAVEVAEATVDIVSVDRALII